MAQEIKKNKADDRKCGFNMPLVIGEKSLCPAQEWVWLINSFQKKVVGLDAKGIEENFSSVLEQSLSSCFSGVEVFWSPAKEKPSEIEFRHKTDSHEKSYCNLDFRGTFIRILHSLNSHYHSHLFLRKLENHLEENADFSSAHVFLLAPSRNKLSLTALYRDDLESQNSGWRKDFNLVVSYNQVKTFDNFIKSLEKRYSKKPVSGMDLIIKNEVIALIEVLADDFDVEGIQGAKEIFRSDLVQAVKHFSLMALYMRFNENQICSIFIAPNFHPRHDSSMAIFWPATPPERNLQYLLQMLLQLNSYPLLIAERTREALMAQRHNIFNLIPYGDLKMAIDEGVEGEGEPYARHAFKKTKLLNVCLNVALRDNLGELQSKNTYREFLEFLYANTNFEEDDFSVKPRLIVSPNYIDIKISDH